MALTEQKRARLEKLSDENGINTKQKNQLWLKWKNLKFW